MKDVYYRTGQAAQILGISTHHLRRLCEAASVEHEISAGGHYHVPMSEIQRLKREGVPPIPQTLEGEDRMRDLRGSRHSSNAAEGRRFNPSEDVIRSAEEVTITENQIRKRRLELEAEELEDRFQERAGKQEEAEEQRYQQAAARKTAEQYRQRIREWAESSLQQVPYEAPREVQTEVYQAVEAALASVSADSPDWMMRNVVDAAVEKALGPWRRKAQVEEAVEKARKSLPCVAQGNWGQLSEWELRAMQKASAAITDLRDNATTAEMEAAARRAGEEVHKEFAHKQACEEVLGWSPLHLPLEATAAEREEGKEAVREALQRLPVGASRQLLESTRDIALVPLKGTIEQREQQRRAQEQAESKRRDAEFNASLYISDVDEYLREKYEFDTYVEHFQTSEKLKKQIKPLLIKQLLQQDMSRDEIRRFIRNRIERAYEG